MVSDRWPSRLTSALLALMALQAALGLLFPGQYRDVDWIRATWHGNDWVTLVVAVPLLSISRGRAAAGSARGLLLWLGALGYALYNDAFYLFGAALNAFFPLYVVLVLVAGAALVATLQQLNVDGLAARFAPRLPAQLLGSCFVCLGAGLACVWLGIWFVHIFLGLPTPVETDAFHLVAALDLSMMVPLLVGGGTSIAIRHRWGVVVTALAGVQASLYLLVLSVNSLAAVRTGLAEWPGELPLWGALCVATTAATALTVGSVRQLQAPRLSS